MLGWCAYNQDCPGQMKTWSLNDNDLKYLKVCYMKESLGFTCLSDRASGHNWMRTCMFFLIMSPNLILRLLKKEIDYLRRWCVPHHCWCQEFSLPFLSLGNVQIRWMKLCQSLKCCVLTLRQMSVFSLRLARPFVCCWPCARRRLEPWPRWLFQQAWLCSELISCPSCRLQSLCVRGLTASTALVLSTPSRFLHASLFISVSVSLGFHVK